MSFGDNGVRIGLAGAGAWGRNIIRTLPAISGTQLTRVASRNPATRQLLTETGQTACQVVPDWSELLRTEAIDAVLIATPVDTHIAIALAAVEQGLPVWIEKPLTLSITDARQLAQRVQLLQLPAMVDHLHLHAAAWQALREQLQGHGPVRAILGVAGNTGPFRAGCPPLWDWGAHDIAMCHDLLDGSPLAIQARHEPLPAGTRGERIRLELAFPAPAADAPPIPVRLHLGNAMPGKTRRFTVYQDHQTLVYDDLASDRLCRYPACEALTRPGGPAVSIDVGDGSPLERSIHHFVRAVRAEIPPPTLDSAIQITETLSRCQQALQ